MLSAIINGLWGSAASLWVGTHYAGLSLADAALCIGASNLAGFVALLVVMRARPVRGAFATWAVFLGTYFGVMVAAAPPLRRPEAFGLMVVPLIFSTGFAIIAYGPVQDRLVARAQRRQRPS